MLFPQSGRLGYRDLCRRVLEIILIGETHLVALKNPEKVQALKVAPEP
jgi:hypothetical protein